MPKRAREEDPVAEDAKPAKRARRAGSTVLSWGQNCMGQVGVGLDISERKKPTVLKELDGLTITQAVAGGMHSAVLTDDGKVYTWGCNDQKALGRNASDEASAVPGLAEGLAEVEVVALSAGDSHTAALTSDGRVFACGCFRDSNGILGFTDVTEEQAIFVQIYPPKPATSAAPAKSSKRTKKEAAATAAAASSDFPAALQIGSGVDHIAILTASKDPKSQLWTLGCPGQGQLARVSERHTERDSFRDLHGTPADIQKRRATVASLQRFLLPHAVPSRLLRNPIVSLFCGPWSTQVIDSKGNVFGSGLNNYSQLGLNSAATVLYDLVPCDNWGGKNIKQIASGQHHALALAADGTVYSVGRGTEGQLGLPKAAIGEKQEVDVPTPLPALQGKAVSSVAAGSACSYAVLADGSAYAWGFAENLQLTTGEDEDQYEPVAVAGQQLQERDILSMDAGGQHAVMVAAPKAK